MTRSASLSLHASGRRLASPMLFAHSCKFCFFIIQNHSHCTSGSIVGHQTQHLNF